MDNSFNRQGFAIQGSNGFLAHLQIFGRILNWLAGLIKLTEKEQEDAGIYLGNQRYK
jgi:hypothetical protein